MGCFSGMGYQHWKPILLELSHLSQNTHFFEENGQKQGHFVPHCQKLSWGVKICQSARQRFGIGLMEFARKMQKFLKCHLASRTRDMA